MTKRIKLLLVFFVLALAVVFTSVVLFQKKQLGTFQFPNIDNIDVSIKVTEFKTVNAADEKYVFLYFEYIVNNNNKNAVQFDPSAIRIKCNNVVNIETQYHSIASAIAEPVPLAAGESTYFLYSVFPAGIKHDAIDSLVLDDAGFSVSAFGGNGTAD